MLRVTEFPIEQLRHALGSEGHVIVAIDTSLGVWLMGAGRRYDRRDDAERACSGEVERGWHLVGPPVASLVLDLGSGAVG